MKKFLVCLLLAFSALNTSQQVTAQDKDSKDQPLPEIRISDKEIDPETRKALEAAIIESKAKTAKIESELNFQTGAVTIGDGLAKINLSDRFRYLDPADAEKVLVELWGNPPSESKSLGMIVPANVGLTTENSWGVLITYQEDGYIKDDDAADINYADLLKEMREGEAEENAERVKQGYAPMTLVGWAATPHYDKASHKLYWAKEFKVGDFPENTLNYDIRVLGRRGVLSLNAIASMTQLHAVEKDIQQVIGFVEFSEGHRYGDFVAGTDKVAAYGIGALIAGKVAAKAGLFKLLALFLVKGWKLVIIAAFAIGTLLKKLIGGRSNEQPGEPTLAE